MTPAATRAIHQRKNEVDLEITRLDERLKNAQAELSRVQTERDALMIERNQLQEALE